MMRRHFITFHQMLSQIFIENIQISPNLCYIMGRFGDILRYPCMMNLFRVIHVLVISLHDESVQGYSCFPIIIGLKRFLISNRSNLWKFFIAYNQKRPSLTSYFSSYNATNDLLIIYRQTQNMSNLRVYIKKQVVSATPPA